MAITIVKGAALGLLADLLYLYRAAWLNDDEREIAQETLTEIENPEWNGSEKMIFSFIAEKVKRIHNL